MVSKLSEIWSGLFIPDADPDFLPIPDPGAKKAPDPVSGSATLTRKYYGMCILSTGGQLRIRSCPCWTESGNSKSGSELKLPTGMVNLTGLPTKLKRWITSLLTCLDDRLGTSRIFKAKIPSSRSVGNGSGLATSGSWSTRFIILSAKSANPD